MTPVRIRLHKTYIVLLATGFGILILGFLALVVLMAVSAYEDAKRPDSRVQITNNASVDVEHGSLAIAGKRFDIGKLAVGESVSFSFRPHDSDYRLVVVLANGRTIDDEMGYVTHGRTYDERIVINDNSAKLLDRLPIKRND